MTTPRTLTEDEQNLHDALRDAARAAALLDLRLDDVEAATRLSGWQHAQRDANRVRTQIKAVREVRAWLAQQVEFIDHIKGETQR